MRKKVFFYLDNRGIPDADLNNPENGNPGIGATQFMFAATPYFIGKSYPDSYDLTILAHHIHQLPKSVHSIRVDSLVDAVEQTEANNGDFFIFRPLSDGAYLKTFRRWGSSKIKFVAWAQNFLRNSELNILSDMANISALVCIGQEQYDGLRDHKIIKKSTAIPHPCDPSTFPDVCFTKRDKVVTYMGALIHSKGFHKLARIWPKILAAEPDAQLMAFIGTGRLYDNGKRLGSWGIAEETYERILKKYLADAKGNPIKSVHFLGKMGLEKMDVLKQTRVGVPNPTGRTETFCVSALEFEACGIPVVSARRNGLLDTIVHELTGYQANSGVLQSRYILKLLKDDALCAEMGGNARAFVTSTFSLPGIMEKWHLLFQRLGNDQCLPKLPPSKFRFTALKQLKVLNARWQALFPGSPSVLAGEEIAKRLFRSKSLHSKHYTLAPWLPPLHIVTGANCRHRI